MRIRCLFVLLLMACISCKKGMFKRPISHDQKECLEKINEAKKDIQNGILVFCDFNKDYSPGYRSLEERIILLKENGIVHNFVDTTNFDYYFVNEYRCYCSYMREKINEKYSNHFIDSILDIADKQWFTKNIDSVIPYYYCDNKALYPIEIKNSKFIDEFFRFVKEDNSFFDNELESKLIYPSKYVKGTASNDWNSVRINFMIDKNGNAKITNYPLKIDFNLESNKKYENYFLEQIEKIIKKKGWTPAKIRGQNVNSDRDISFYFR